MTRTVRASRGEILRAVSAAADTRLDGRLPVDVEGVGEVFADERELLGALQLRWHTRLSGRIERELVHQPLDLEAAVITAWQRTAEELPGARAVLDHHREQPGDVPMAEAVATATAKEHALLAMAAGRAGMADRHAAEAGGAIERRARDTHRPTRREPRPESHGGLLGRIRAVLAA